jgi:hypothetical protein
LETLDRFFSEANAKDLPEVAMAESTPPSGAMEGRGAYDRHAELPARGGAFALPHFERAVRALPLDTGDQPIVIADYGSSQGKNSLAPMRIAIEALRTRRGPDRPIVVYHVDLPANDFNALFETLQDDPERYVLNQPNVFPCAIGRSFYENVLPPGGVHIGWSSYAAMWVSRIPTRIPGHFFVLRSAGEVRAAFDQQGARDWERFLSLRSRELRAGGRLVVSVPAANDDDVSGFEDIMDHVNAVLAEMVGEGAVTQNERARMVIGAWPRRRRDLLAPFARGGKFMELKVEHCETNSLPDAAWANYQGDGDEDALASAHALFFRTVFAPTLAGALAPSGEPERRRAFSDRLEIGLKQRLADRPQPIDSLVETIVLAKSDAE